MNLYWCVDCKTCKTRQRLRHMEFDRSEDPTIELNFPASFETRCEACGAVNSYSAKDLYDLDSEEPPPPEFTNRF